MQSLPSWSCGFNLPLVQLVGRFWVFFLSHTAPGFPLWFYFHLCMWVVHWGLLLRLPWRTWVCPCEGQVWRWCSCLGLRVLAAPGTQESWWLGQQEIQCSRGAWQPVLANRLQYPCLENSPPWQKSLAGHSLQGHRVRHCQSNHTRIDARCFLPVAALPQWELSVKVAQLLGLQGPWQRQVCRDTDCFCCRSYGLSESFFRASCSWPSKGLFGQSFSIALPVQALRGLPCLGPFSVVPACQQHKGAPRCWCVGRKRLWWWLYPLWVTQQYRLASIAARLSSTGIPTTISSLTSPRSVSTLNRSPCPGACSTIPKLQLLAAEPSRGPAFLSGVCMAATGTVWFSFHLGCHRSPVSLSALNVSPLTQTIALMRGSVPLLQFPHLQRTGPVLLTLLVQSSYRVLLGSIYSFPLVRYFLRSQLVVLHALLCLKVYSWCIHGERGMPHPCTPLPSCSLLTTHF